MESKAVQVSKTALGLALSLLVFTACGDKKSNSNPIVTPSEDVCVSTPKECEVGEKFELGYYLSSAIQRVNLNSNLTFETRMGFYGTDANGLNEYSINGRAVYYGAVKVVGTVSLKTGQQVNDQGSAMSGVPCAMSAGDYVVSTTGAGTWFPDYGTNYNGAYVDEVQVLLSKGSETVQGRLRSVALNLNRTNSTGHVELKGHLILDQRNDQSCFAVIQF